MDILNKNEGSRNKFKEISYILGRETLVPDKNIGMNIWQDRVFIFMSRNSQRATIYFNVPQKDVFEIGSQVTI